jgi:AcrR family transcriptional regulator
MNRRGTYRADNRDRLRAGLLDAARELTIARGWDGVRMADVAAAVGVSRQTVYNEFRDKATLAAALAAREADRLLDGVRAELAAHGGDVRAAAEAAVRHALRQAAENPLVKAILADPGPTPDGLLPYLTTRTDLVVAAGTAVVRDWAAAHVAVADERVIAVGAESIVRLVVSHVVRPSAPAEQTAAELADLLARIWR